MSEKNIANAERYYKSMAAKDMNTIKTLLHPNVRLISPLATIEGKDTVVDAADKFSKLINHLTIRSKFGSGDHVMLAYNLDCPPPIGSFRAATLITFKQDLIAEIELFYDARPFEKSGIFNR